MTDRPTRERAVDALTRSHDAAQTQADAAMDYALRARAATRRLERMLMRGAAPEAVQVAGQLVQLARLVELRAVAALERRRAGLEVAAGIVGEVPGSPLERPARRGRVKPSAGGRDAL